MFAFAVLPRIKKQSDQLKHFCGCDSDERSPSASDLFAHKRRSQDSSSSQRLHCLFKCASTPFGKRRFRRLSSRAAERTQCSILFPVPSHPEAPPSLQSKQLQTTTLQNKKRAGTLRRRIRYLSAHGNPLVVCNKVLRRRRSSRRN